MFYCDLFQKEVKLKKTKIFKKIKLQFNLNF